MSPPTSVGDTVPWTHSWSQGHRRRPTLPALPPAPACPRTSHQRRLCLPRPLLPQPALRGHVRHSSWERGRAGVGAARAPLPLLPLLFPDKFKNLIETNIRLGSQGRNCVPAKPPDAHGNVHTLVLQGRRRPPRLTCWEQTGTTRTVCTDTTGKGKRLLTSAKGQRSRQAGGWGWLRGSGPRGRGPTTSALGPPAWPGSRKGTSQALVWGRWVSPRGVTSLPPVAELGPGAELHVGRELRGVRHEAG